MQRSGGGEGRGGVGEMCMMHSLRTGSPWISSIVKHRKRSKGMQQCGSKDDCYSF